MFSWLGLGGGGGGTAPVLSVLIFDMISASPRFLSSLVLVYLVITKPCLSMNEFSVGNLGG
jgi:hypothetical protein